MAAVASLLIFVIEVYILVVLIAVILRWVYPPYSTNAIARFFFAITEPVLAPIRRRLPFVGGFDLSPLVVWVAGSVLIALLRNLVR
ncbi:MAG TPA: YggT family protein [Candidatus Dormibacteraeota bacterium]|nr:YggT family protein [Candidatus Dormibacteraeota bacterium]